MPSTTNISSPEISSSSATKCAQVLGHRRLDLEADHAAAPALLQRRLEQAHEILGLFLDLEIAVADDPERALPLHVVARERAGSCNGRSPARGR